MISQPLISIIVPVFNGSKVLTHCLDALNSSTCDSYEIIVVDDKSTDNSAEIARQRKAVVYRMTAQSGPAAARNLGAEKASGEILFFVDADVVVQRDSVSRVADDFNDHSDVAAVFGSYDAEPAEPNFVSQYKNLYHHFIHQRSQVDATTFWAGCGAIRRSVFESVKGFDGNLYSRPSIEDIELGYRLRAQGHKILLDKTLQCKHLKRWTLTSLLRADIFHRAMPWSQLILRSNQPVNDLNLQTRDRICAALVCLSLIALPLSLFKPQVLIGVLIALSLVFILNYKLFRFFRDVKGPGFMALAFLMQLLHYSYSSVTFFFCWVGYVFNLSRRK